MNKETRIPIAVIGMGAAGSMAALEAGKFAKTVLFDGNEKLGKKIYITGKGRCNLTNIAGRQAFIQQIIHNGKFFYSAFSAFSNQDLMDFFDKEGCPLQVERGGRVFPKSNHASDINRTLEKALVRTGVVLKKNHLLRAVDRSESDFLLHFEEAGQERCFRSKLLILATGGCSYPSTGARGDGYRFAHELGHTIEPPSPSLVPLLLSDPDLAGLQGLSLRNVALTARWGKKEKRLFGEALFTDRGLSGPIALSLSAYLSGQKLDHVTLSLNLKPALDEAELKRRLQREREAGPNRALLTLLESLLPKSLARVLGERAGFDLARPLHQMTRAEEALLIRYLHDFPLSFASLGPFSSAVITRGGVRVKEVDPSTMASKLCPGLYVAGELLDLDGLTGGYNLQIAFSTGYVAGRSAGMFYERSQNETQGNCH